MTEISPITVGHPLLSNGAGELGGGSVLCTGGVEDALEASR